MAIKPILFNTEMSRAILDGRKTATRRAIKPQPTEHLTRGPRWRELLAVAAEPYNPGDILWVRETWAFDTGEDDEYGTGSFVYKADDGEEAPCGRWHPSIHMPKEAARTFLRVTGVRVDRLQEIDKQWENYDKEGMRNSAFQNISIAMQKKFISIWDSIIKKADLQRYGWNANPWVWVIEFERCEKPEGFL